MEERRQLAKGNGNWKKTMGDTETFKLVLFLNGNGCEPNLIRRWIMLAQHWAETTTKAEKRASRFRPQQCRPEKPSVVLL